MLRAIDPKSAIPIYRQILDQVQRGVAAGALVPGEQLPTVRDLATQLLVNPNTVARAYRDLEQAGLVETRRGDGTYIATAAPALREADKRRLLAEAMRGVARDVHAFGVAEEEAQRLFGEALAAERPGRGRAR